MKKLGTNILAYQIRYFMHQIRPEFCTNIGMIELNKAHAICTRNSTFVLIYASKGSAHSLPRRYGLFSDHGPIHKHHHAAWRAAAEQRDAETFPQHRPYGDHYRQLAI